jgi:hypothetical protein
MAANVNRYVWSVACLLLSLGAPASSRAGDPFHAGPIFDHFDLTLAPGERTEVLGPLFYEEQKEAQHTWAIPPLLSESRDPSLELREFDFLYPLLTYDRYGNQYRWQFCEVITLAGGPTQQETNRNRLTLFPIYFQQRSSDPGENYTAVVPFYGHLKHQLFRDDIFFVMFPFYSETRKRDVVTDNYLYPFFHLRHGDQLTGWQFWPLVGQEHKGLTTATNGFGDVQMIGGHDSLFVLWPLFLNDHTGLGTTNAAWEQASLPAYSFLRSPQRDSTTVLWPFFSRVDDREKQYREWDAPWPLIVFARGEGKTTSRVWPFFSQAHSTNMESDFYLWPIYKYNAGHFETLDRERHRVAFFLYDDVTDKNRETGASRRRTGLWPFFMRQRDLAGNTRLQVLALLEEFVLGSHKTERDWSPVWSVWRSEKNPRANASSQSLLWNLYRHDAAPAHERLSLLFGLFQREADSGAHRTRLFFIPLGKTQAEPSSFGPVPQ